MMCPTCNNVQLVMSERQGIEIDYCPTCRGVWLDRGELDKIIQRSAADEMPAQRAAPAPPQYQSDPRQGHNQGYSNHGKPYRKKNIWEEIFD